MKGKGPLTGVLPHHQDTEGVNHSSQDTAQVTRLSSQVTVEGVRRRVTDRLTVLTRNEIRNLPRTWIRQLLQL